MPVATSDLYVFITAVTHVTTRDVRVFSIAPTYTPVATWGHCVFIIALTPVATEDLIIFFIIPDQRLRRDAGPKFLKLYAEHPRFSHIERFGK